ncbi:MAG TPA: 50S ribosomal protein L20 [Thermoanaerobaculia bacterium]|nr:50S ribosomal protein L20 [Thermoanaerobaculia bacterium]HUM30687.1 50S ribosomal protein L20 [Thermoanaerobaculia bacterium]HXK68905.1 50S ribosomal protein L20 [Thermoanaerobaculia bacterium]
MPRVRRGNNKLQRRKKLLERAKGYFGTRRRLYRTVKEQVERSLQFAYRDRRARKRDFRRLWSVRINAACRLNGVSYSQFIHGLHTGEIAINRKILADMAVHDPQGFTQLVDVARQALQA